ncbi:hypothetical protein [Erythrobacter sp. Alg231-14]|uniref:hypothetical protein n=1 Tax=Erythrobacter sp. Alg231-14 TaxID=1922225 RepID=UPI000D54FAC8
MKTFKTLMTAAALAVTLPFAAPAAAQEFPLVAGEYMEVSGIFVNDGAEFQYAQHLADNWARLQEHAKMQGWITDYEILINVNPREGEPHIYLTTTFAAFADAAEQERRNAQMNEFAGRSVQQLISESGDRAEYRTIVSSMLLQEYKPR